MNGGGEYTDDNVSEAAEGMRVGAVRFEAVTGTGEHQWKLIYLRHDVEKGVADQGRRLAANEQCACFGSMIIGGRDRSQGLPDGWRTCARKCEEVGRVKRPNSTGAWEGRQSLSKLEPLLRSSRPLQR